jgi:hypothetical protein
MSQPKSKLSRRSLIAGASTAGVAAAAVAIVPGTVLEPAAQATPKEPPARGGGYHLSEHIKQYYKTTLI